MRKLLFTYFLPQVIIFKSYALANVTSMMFGSVRVDKLEWHPKINKTANSNLECTTLCQSYNNSLWCNSFQTVISEIGLKYCSMSSQYFASSKSTPNVNATVKVFVRKTAVNSWTNTTESPENQACPNHIIQDNETAIMILHTKLINKRRYIKVHLLSDDLEMCRLENPPSIPGQDMIKKELSQFAYTKNKGIVISCGGFDSAKGKASPMARCIFWSLADKEQVAWNTSLSLPIPSRRLMVISSDRKAIFIGGMGGPSYVFVFDSDQMKVDQVVHKNGPGFTVLPNNHDLDSSCAVALSYDTFIVIGGRMDMDSSKTILDNVVMVLTASWGKAVLPSLDSPRYGHACGLVTLNGKSVIMVAGGKRHSATTMTDILTMDANKLDKWTSHGSAEATLFIPSANVINLKTMPGKYAALSLGGQDSFLFFRILDVDSGTWEQKDDLVLITEAHNAYAVAVEMKHFDQSLN